MADRCMYIGRYYEKEYGESVGRPEYIVEVEKYALSFSEEALEKFMEDKSSYSWRKRIIRVCEEDDFYYDGVGILDEFPWL